MHDPMTVAHQIKYPWKTKPSQFFPQGYRETLITIWHCDPEIGGSDDSCGFSYARLSEKDCEWANKIAERDFEQWFSEDFKSINLYFAGPFEVIIAAYREARRYLGVSYHKPLSHREISRCMNLASNPLDNIRSSSNAAKTDLDEFARLLRCVLRIIRTDSRWWFQHPKWHVWHWQIKIEPLTVFKRWAFSRCGVCHGRFAWNESPTTTSWHSTGPLWFRSEKDIYHSGCVPQGVYEHDSASLNQNS